MLKNNFQEAFPGASGQDFPGLGGLDAEEASKNRARFAAQVEQEPANTAAWINLGAACAALGEWDSAEQSLQQALALDPGSIAAHYNLGSVLQAQGKWDEAATEFRLALKRNPYDLDVLNNLGNVLVAQGDLQSAVDCFRRALKLNRKDGTVRANLGRALYCAGAWDEAEREYGEALAMDGANLPALYGMASALARQARFGEALNHVERALALAPDNASSLALKGGILRSLGRLEEAEEILRGGVEMAPGNASAWSNLGAVLRDRGRLPESESALRRALALGPGSAAAWANLGNTLMDLGRAEEAMAAYDEAVGLDPESPSVRWNRALCLLANGELERGFQEFEWRLRRPDAAHLYMDCGAPLWQGEPLTGKRILLVAEQGLGDTLQFVRYAPLLAERGAEVYLKVPKPLHRLLARTAGIAGLAADGKNLPGMDYSCPLMSLPARFGTTLATIPASLPYLAAEPQQVAAWRQRLGQCAGSGPRVGVVWAGDPRPEDPEANRIDRLRSMSLERFGVLFDIPGIVWVSLQKGMASQQLGSHSKAPEILDWTNELEDFADTAALVEALDLVITVDTSVAHLAGGLGRPVWMLSRYNGCWRWLLDREDTPWYPGMQIYRQDEPGNWEKVLDSVSHDLRIWRDRRSMEEGGAVT